MLLEKTPRDNTHDYQLSYGWPHSQFHTWATAATAQNPVRGDNEAAMLSSLTPVATDDTAAVRRFLEDASVLRSDEGPMALSKMRAYVNVHLMR